MCRKTSLENGKRYFVRVKAADESVKKVNGARPLPL